MRIQVKTGSFTYNSTIGFDTLALAHRNDLYGQNNSPLKEWFTRLNIKQNGYVKYKKSHRQRTVFTADLAWKNYKNKLT
jgi:hypothetical protein